MIVFFKDPNYSKDKVKQLYVWTSFKNGKINYHVFQEVDSEGLTIRESKFTKESDPIFYSKYKTQIEKSCKRKFVGFRRERIL